MSFTIEIAKFGSAKKWLHNLKYNYHRCNEDDVSDYESTPQLKQSAFHIYCSRLWVINYFLIVLAK